MADAVFETIEADTVLARQIALTDAAGEPRMIATCDSDSGMSGIALHDLQGVPRIAIALDASGNPSVSLHSSDGSAGLMIGFGQNGTNVVILDSDGDRTMVDLDELPRKSN